MNGLALLHVTFADSEEAERVARTVVEERLAACANLLGPCRSIYRWEGAVESAEEARVLFKTASARVAVRVAQLHSYSLPAIEYWPVGAAKALVAWAVEATGGPFPDRA